MKKYRIKAFDTDSETTEYTPQKRIFFFWFSYPVKFKKITEAIDYIRYKIKRDKKEHIRYTFYE